MRKKMTSFLLLSLGASFLVSCVGPMGSSAGSTSDTPSLPPASSSLTEPQLAIRDDGNYYIGDTYSTLGEPTVYLEDGESSRELDVTFLNLDVVDPWGYDFETTDPFSVAGDYIVDASFSYEGEEYTLAYTFYVNSLLDIGTSPLHLSVELEKEPTPGMRILDDNEIILGIEWLNYGVEYFRYEEENAEFALELFENQHALNVINEPLMSDRAYDLRFSFRGQTASYAFSLDEGYVAISDPSFTSDEIDSSYAPSNGPLNVLVVPISLDPGAYAGLPCPEWNETTISTLNDAFFGDSDTLVGNRPSFKTYFELASYGEVSIEGFVADVYYELDTRYTMSAIMNDSTYGRLSSLMQRAVAQTIENHPEIDWSDFDRNNDARFDAIHFVTNVPDQYTMQAYVGDWWSTPLWPHMSELEPLSSASHELPSVGAYSMNALGFFNDAMTAVHEQGHIFGIDDYYDYSYNREYLGSYDMQGAGTMLDWNPFSKFAVGWGTPYVVTGLKEEVTIDIGAFSATGESIIIPANYENFNGSAFSEYLMIELYSDNVGVNAYDWFDDYYPRLGNGYGIRLYHVDARLWEAPSYSYINSGNFVSSPEERTDGYNYLGVGCNNSYDSSAYGSSPSPRELERYPLINIIEADGRNDLINGYSSILEASDLFYSGDVFSWNEYSDAHHKDGREMTTMHDGTTFPYEISFDEVTSTSATITISFR